MVQRLTRTSSLNSHSSCVVQNPSYIHAVFAGVELIAVTGYRSHQTGERLKKKVSMSMIKVTNLTKQKLIKLHE